MAASDVESELRQPIGTPADNEPGGTMTLVEHLEELRRRIIISAIAIAVFSIIGFIFWQRILDFLLLPLPEISVGLLGPNHKLVQKDLGEAFLISLKLSLAVGFALASPVVLFQMWRFIAPGLTSRERKYALPFTVLGTGLFAIGMATGFVVLHYPIAWLIGFGKDNFVLLLDANSYFTFVAYFLLAFGIVFELPLVLTFLSLVGIVTSQFLRAKRKYILFGLWFLSCFITPGADPYSPIIIGLALTILFEFSIILMRILKK
jgi:sec-independent protein translocase protein TatC